MSIKENYERIRSEVPSNVKIVVAAKTRTISEIEELIAAGATDIGENYVQEAEIIARGIKKELFQKVSWHMIGPLQKNKINKALPLFDYIQTIDSLDLAKDIDSRVVKSGKDTIPVLLEINIGSEGSKHGIKPDEHEQFYKYLAQLVQNISLLNHIRLEGLMTMGPLGASSDQYRHYFRNTKNIFEYLKNLNINGTEMKYLSMGMTDSYNIAIEEGANMVRIGTAIFGPRECSYGKSKKD